MCVCEREREMALSSWLCAHSTRSMFVKIVYPGGRVELHDRPLLAAEIMQRNPRCWVAQPNVFRHPLSAVVPPDTVLLLGQKFYVVPARTLRKLRRRHSPGPASPGPASPGVLASFPTAHDHPSPYPGPQDPTPASCSIFGPNGCYRAPTQQQQQHGDSDASSSAARSCSSERCREGTAVEEGRVREDGCLGRFLPGISAKPGHQASMEHKLPQREVNPSEERGGSPTPCRHQSSSPPTPHQHWQPSLDSIVEE